MSERGVGRRNSGSGIKELGRNSPSNSSLDHDPHGSKEKNETSSRKNDQDKSDKAQKDNSEKEIRDLIMNEINESGPQGSYKEEESPSIAWLMFLLLTLGGASAFGKNIVSANREQLTRWFRLPSPSDDLSMCFMIFNLMSVIMLALIVNFHKLEILTVVYSFLICFGYLLLLVSFSNIKFYLMIVGFGVLGIGAIGVRTVQFILIYVWNSNNILTILYYTVMVLNFEQVMEILGYLTFNYCNNELRDASASFYIVGAVSYVFLMLNFLYFTLHSTYEDEFLDAGSSKHTSALTITSPDENDEEDVPTLKPNFQRPYQFKSNMAGFNDKKLGESEELSEEDEDVRFVPPPKRKGRLEVIIEEVSSQNRGETIKKQLNLSISDLRFMKLNFWIVVVLNAILFNIRHQFASIQKDLLHQRYKVSEEEAYEHLCATNLASIFSSLIFIRIYTNIKFKLPINAFLPVLYTIAFGLLYYIDVDNDSNVLLYINLMIGVCNSLSIIVSYHSMLILINRYMVSLLAIAIFLVESLVTALVSFCYNKMLEGSGVEGFNRLLFLNIILSILSLICMVLLVLYDISNSRVMIFNISNRNMVKYKRHVDSEFINNTVHEKNKDMMYKSNIIKSLTIQLNQNARERRRTRSFNVV